MCLEFVYVVSPMVVLFDHSTQSDALIATQCRQPKANSAAWFSRNGIGGGGGCRRGTNSSNTHHLRRPICICHYFCSKANMVIVQTLIVAARRRQFYLSDYHQFTRHAVSLPTATVSIFGCVCVCVRNSQARLVVRFASFQIAFQKH